jgi:hypothetical protein
MRWRRNLRLARGAFLDLPHGGAAVHRLIAREPHSTVRFTAVLRVTLPIVAVTVMT